MSSQSKLTMILLQQMLLLLYEIFYTEQIILNITDKNLNLVTLQIRSKMRKITDMHKIYRQLSTEYT